MSQDVIADALNQIMNAKKVKKNFIEIRHHSKVLINLLNIMKEKGYINFHEENKKIIIELIKLNECYAIKPRFNVGVNEINKYLRRFLPSRNFGTLIISTNKGLMEHEKAEENKIGGSLIAYFY
ncbi:MAG: 30S ribosomal protein S8 [Nanoarchaeota archaeon]